MYDNSGVTSVPKVADHSDLMIQYIRGSSAGTRFTVSTVSADPRLQVTNTETVLVLVPTCSVE